MLLLMVNKPFIVKKVSILADVLLQWFQQVP